jgi:hypothetical protein
MDARDAVMKVGLKPESMSVFYEPLDRLLAEL